MVRLAVKQVKLIVPGTHPAHATPILVALARFECLEVNAMQGSPLEDVNPVVRGSHQARRAPVPRLLLGFPGLWVDFRQTTGRDDIESIGPAAADVFDTADPFDIVPLGE